MMIYRFWQVFVNTLDLTYTVFVEVQVGQVFLKHVGTFKREYRELWGARANMCSTMCSSVAQSEGMMFDMMLRTHS